MCRAEAGRRLTDSVDADDGSELSGLAVNLDRVVKVLRRWTALCQYIV